MAKSTAPKATATDDADFEPDEILRGSEVPTRNDRIFVTTPEFFHSAFLPMTCVISGRSQDVRMEEIKLPKPPHIKTDADGRPLPNPLKLPLPFAGRSHLRYKWSRGITSAVGVGTAICIYQAMELSRHGVQLWWITLVIIAVLFVLNVGLNFNLPSIQWDGIFIKITFPKNHQSLCDEWKAARARFEDSLGSSPPEESENPWSDTHGSQWDDDHPRKK